MIVKPLDRRPVDADSGLPLAEFTDALRSAGADAWRVHYAALRRRQAGEDVVVLTVGDPDFDTPAPIVDAAVDAMRGGDTHYTVSGGVGRLADTIAQIESARLGRPITPDEVVTTVGAQNALFSLFRCLLQSGDEALLLSPPYNMFAGLAHIAGAAVRMVPLDTKRGFALDVDAIEAAFSHRTRLVLANFPHNPSGALAKPEDLARLVDLCRERGVWLISDEAYADLVYEGEFISPAQLPGDNRHVVAVRSLSKSHAMTGWRMGWVVAGASLCAHLRNLISHVSYGSPGFIEAGAIAALTAPIPEVAEMRDAYRARRDALCEVLGDQPGFALVRPPAGIFCVADVSATGMDGNTFAERLLEAQGVSVLSGATFAPELEHHVRIALCAPAERLRDAARRIRSFVEQAMTEQKAMAETA
ncbi:MAG: pyridoxal phosphate-dependent aminotransferase [Pseudomonadota bacterium]